MLGRASPAGTGHHEFLGPHTNPLTREHGRCALGATVQEDAALAGGIIRTRTHKPDDDAGTGSRLAALVGALYDAGDRHP